MTALVNKLVESAISAIDTPDRWTKGAFAKNKDGFEVASDDTAATCFCIYGALEKAKYSIPIEYKDYYKVIDAIYDSIEFLYPRKYLGVADFNDHPTTNHKMVIRVLKHVQTKFKEKHND